MIVLNLHFDKMKIAFTSPLLALLISTNAFGAIINSSTFVNFDGSSPDSIIVNSTGSALTSGYAGTGYFTISDSEVSNLIVTNDFSTLATFFVTFGTDDFATGVDNIFGTGDIAGGFAIVNDSVDPTAAIGRTLYSFFGDGGSIADSTEVGLYRHAEVLTADPAAPAPPNEYFLYINGGEILVGDSTTGTTVIDGETINHSALRLFVIPEPSSLILGGLGSLLVLRRRR